MTLYILQSDYKVWQSGDTVTATLAVPDEEYKKLIISPDEIERWVPSDNSFRVRKQY